MIAVAHEYGLRSRESRKHLGVFCGRRLIAKVVFRGKTPCVALALDPSEYAGTKYRGVDMSRYKTYARTPMMIKLTSQRRMAMRNISPARSFPLRISAADNAAKSSDKTGKKAPLRGRFSRL